MADAWDPVQYARFAREREQPFFDLLSKVARRGGGRAVDLGCGTGKLTRSLHEHVGAAQTIGVELSPRMLALSGPYEGRGVSFVEADLGLWVPPGPLDLVFSNAAIHWVPDHAALLSRLAGFLAPGGQLAIQLPNNEAHPAHAVALALSGEAPFAAGTGGSPTRAQVLPLEEYALLLHRCGLAVEEVSARVYLHVLPSRDEVVEWVRGTTLTPLQARLAPDVYREFLERYRERLFALLPDERPFAYPFRRVFLVARRA
jgi:trans-aconitate 2-methyltransferase